MPSFKTLVLVSLVLLYCTVQVGCIPCMLYIASGSSTDWAHGEVGIGFTTSMELRDTGLYGYVDTLYYIQGVPEYSQHYISYVVQVPASRGADRPHGGGDLGLPRDRDQGADGPADVDRLYFNDDEEIDCIS